MVVIYFMRLVFDMAIAVLTWAVGLFPFFAVEGRRAEGRLPLRLGRHGLHGTFVGSVERGERNLSILGVRTMAKVLRVSMADLFADLP